MTSRAVEALLYVSRNDYPPVLNLPATVSLREDAGTGASLFLAVATDQDQTVRISEKYNI